MAIEVPRPAAADATELGRRFDDLLEPIYAYVALRLDDRAAAEDVTARAFIRAAEAIRNGSIEPDELHGYVLRVASSACVDHARRRRKGVPGGVRASDLDDPGDAVAAAWLADAPAARAFAAAIDGIKLRRALVGLEDPELRAVVLRYLDGLDLDGIAVVLGCSRDAAGMRLHRALAALAGEDGLEATGDDSGEEGSNAHVA